jgi:predicted methyltransferase
MRNGVGPQVMEAVFRVLRPGGIFGVVQHRDAEGAAVDPTRGYVPEAAVIELATAAGFELVERSEINANPRDTRDHPNGVWSLPPALRGGDVDRDRFVAIGESDRMTLKFRRPATTPESP